MANKARYYGLVTKQEMQDVTTGSGVLLDGGGVLTYAAVTTAIRNYKAKHPNFDDLSSEVAADRIATVLNKNGTFGEVHARGSRISGGGGYSIALSKGNKSNGIIYASKKSERINNDEHKKRRR